MKKIVMRLNRRTGVITTLYTEAIDLTRLGRLHIERASNVEFDNMAQGWVVAFPDGSRLPDTFRSRQAALDAEVTYLQRRIKEGDNG